VVPAHCLSLSVELAQILRCRYRIGGRIDALKIPARMGGMGGILTNGKRPLSISGRTSTVQSAPELIQATANPRESGKMTFAGHKSGPTHDLPLEPSPAIPREIEPKRRGKPLISCKMPRSQTAPPEPLWIQSLAGNPANWGGGTLFPLPNGSKDPKAYRLRCRSRRICLRPLFAR